MNIENLEKHIFNEEYVSFDPYLKKFFKYNIYYRSDRCQCIEIPKTKHIFSTIYMQVQRLAKKGEQNKAEKIANSLKFSSMG